MEGPVPRLDTRMCVLLSITPLVVADLIEEEENPLDESDNWKERHEPYTRRKSLVSCLQILGDFQSLLSPPQSIVSSANLAAARAMMFVAGIDVADGYFECINVNDLPINCSKYFSGFYYNFLENFHSKLLEILCTILDHHLL